MPHRKVMGDRMKAEHALMRATELACWQDPSQAQLLGGGMTNFNVRLSDQGREYVVRVGGDIPLHQVMRFNEQACHRAAEAIGLSPRIVHIEPGILAMEFVAGRPLLPEDVCDPAMIARVVPLLQRLHGEGLKALRGPVLMFWVFHILRDYAAALTEGGSPHLPGLSDLLGRADALQAAVGPVEIVLSHNDLLPANLIDAGERLWLIDWDYGGLNSPLFDLAGLASNCGFSAAQEQHMLEIYFDRPLKAELWRRYGAMKCASLLRETMWSMVSELHSKIDFDYAAYTAENRARFEAAYQDFLNL